MTDLDNKSPRRVLVCDDNRDIREFIETALSDLVPDDYVFATTVVDNGRDALNQVKKAFDAGDPFCVAFIDHRLPQGWSGLETAARIRAIDPQIELVLITAYDDLGSNGKELAHIGSPSKYLILKKPLSLEEIIQTALNLSEKWRIEALRDRQEQELASAHESLKRSYKKMEQAQQALIEAEKMAAVGRLASGVAHEFNNILTGVLGYAQLSLASGDLKEMTDALNSIRDLGWRAKRIVDGLLSFARKQPRRLRRGNLQQVLEKVIDLVEKSGGEPVVRVVRNYQEIPDTDFDADQMSQVFLNLMLNARQAAKDNEVTITIGTRVVGGQIEVSIKDDGTGIPQDVLPKIFDPFFTTKGALGGGGQGGTGLGLSIALGIVKEHGGNIEVKPNPDTGSEFIISLPMDRGVNQAGNAENILVIDGNNPSSILNRDVLERAGFNVDIGDKDVLEHLDHLKRYAVIVLDPFSIGLSNPVETLKRIAAHIPVLLVTAFQDYQFRVLAGVKGIDSIEKPYTPQDLMNKINELIR